ncbi:MAG: GDP-mannose 4,6-dehydratase [Chitinophagaceae bacterium]|nr:GDP-mannose 4,6-dehydratase [Chitinophagaceae bacterium]
MNWIGKKTLVTGAGGFIGSHLCETLLELGADVTAMVHYNSRGDWGNLEFLSLESKQALRLVSGNIEDSGFMSRHIKGQHVVFHLAALIAIPYSYTAPLSYVHTNIEGTINVLEAARDYDIEKIIHTSTSETYGTAIYTPIDETHPLQGQSPYSASKIGADKLVESYYRSFNLPVATIRPFNTYGPRQSTRAVIPTIITQALTQNEIRLGSLDPVRDMNFVKDTAAGFVKVAESPKSIGEVINVGSGKGYTIQELVTTILQIMKVEKKIVLDEDRLRPENSEVFKLICDNTKSKNLTGWQPLYSLEEGIRETIDFISNHMDIYKPGTYTL